MSKYIISILFNGKSVNNLAYGYIQTIDNKENKRRNVITWVPINNIENNHIEIELNLSDENSNILEGLFLAQDTLGALLTNYEYYNKNVLPYLTKTIENNITTYEGQLIANTLPQTFTQTDVLDVLKRTFTKVNILEDSTNTNVVASIEVTYDAATYSVLVSAKNSYGVIIGSIQSARLPINNSIVDATYNEQTKMIVLTARDGTLKQFSIAPLISGLQREINANNKLNADYVDDSTSTNKFLTQQEKDAIANNTSRIAVLENTKVAYTDIFTAQDIDDLFNNEGE